MNFQVFQFNQEELKLLQSLKSHTLISMTTIKFAQQVYVAALTKYAGLKIYRYMGISGFELITKTPIKVSEAVEMTSFNLEVWKYNLPRPFIAITTGRTMQIIHSSITGDAKENPGLKNNLCSV